MKAAFGIGALGLAALFVACYSPNIQNGAWSCDPPDNFVCPTGFTCDRTTFTCVQAIITDGGVQDVLPSFDLKSGPEMRTCDQRVAAGAFSNLVSLGAINTSADEKSIALSPDGGQIYFYSGGVFMTATLSGNRKTAGAATAVTLTGAPTTINGGSFASDGSYWLSGSVGGTTSVFQATRNSTTSFTVGAPHQPSSTCAFTDPIFTDGNSGGELYVAAPLGDPGCSSSNSMVAQGALDKLMGGFYGAFAGRGFRAPFVLPGGLTMLTGSSGSPSTLSVTTRAATNVQWVSPLAVSMGSIGAADDAQAVVSPDCSVLYLVSHRAGGAGGYDIFSADIASQ